MTNYSTIISPFIKNFCDKYNINGYNLAKYNIQSNRNLSPLENGNFNHFMFYLFIYNIYSDKDIKNIFNIWKLFNAEVDEYNFNDYDISKIKWMYNIAKRLNPERTFVEKAISKGAIIDIYSKDGILIEIKSNISSDPEKIISQVLGYATLLWLNRKPLKEIWIVSINHKFIFKIDAFNINFEELSGYYLSLYDNNYSISFEDKSNHDKCIDLIKNLEQKNVKFLFNELLKFYNLNEIFDCIDKFNIPSKKEFLQLPDICKFHPFFKPFNSIYL